MSKAPPRLDHGLNGRMALPLWVTTLFPQRFWPLKGHVVDTSFQLSMKRTHRQKTEDGQWIIRPCNNRLPRILRQYTV